MALLIQVSLNHFNGLTTLVGPNISGFTGPMYLDFLFSTFDSHLFYPPSSTSLHLLLSTFLLLFIYFYLLFYFSSSTSITIIHLLSFFILFTIIHLMLLSLHRDCLPNVQTLTTGAHQTARDLFVPTDVLDITLPVHK